MASTIQSSTEALESALVAMRNLGCQISQYRGDAIRRISSGLDVLSSARSRAIARVEQAESALQAARAVPAEKDTPPRDFSAHEAAAEAARNEVRYLESLSNRGRSLLDEVTTAERRVMHLADYEVSEAQAFVRDSLERLRDFQALRPDSGDSANGAPRAISSESSQRLGNGSAPGHTNSPPSPLELIGTRLPDGFEWVSVDHLTESPDFREEDLHFKNSSREDFRELYERFRGRIMPVMLAHGDNARAKLEQIDAAAHSFDAKSLCSAYSLFFGADKIAISKSSNSIINGRHRIWTAKQLGWSHIPAQVLK